MAISAAVAAKRLCELSGWKLSNLAVQKMLYVAHMIYLGHQGAANPLLRERFEAWDYGPVVPKLYHRLKAFGGSSVKNVFHSVNERLDVTEDAVLQGTWTALSKKSPSELVAMTHVKNGAWAKHYKPNTRGNVIPNEDILAEYENRIGQHRG